MNKYYRISILAFFAAGIWLWISQIALGADTLAYRRFPIEVYASLTSVAQGQNIDFMVANGDSSLVASQYQMRIFRVGATDSLYYTVPGSYFLQYQPLHSISGSSIPRHNYTQKPYDFRIGCSWPAAYTLTVPTNWKSGFYYVKCSLTSDTTVFRRTPFVVKAASPGTSSKILYKVPFNTYQAYTSWGGSSLYSGDDTNFVLYNDTISFLRPLGGQGDTHLERTDIGAFDIAERSFIQWAEGAGYVMEYCTNVDLDFDGSSSNPNQYGFISKYKFLVTSGHDEYWTWDERNDVELSFIPSQSIGGGNAAFLSGNVCYWRATYSPDRTRMWVGKYSGSNYVTDYQWRSPVQARPEARFVGVQVSNTVQFEYTGETDIVRLPTHWLFKNVSPPYSYGNQFGYGYSEPDAGPGIVGGEVDARADSSPTNIEIISSNTFQNGEVHEAGFYINTSSNARVFGAGSIYWSRGLKTTDTSDVRKFKAIMTTMMDHFSEKKFLGPIYSTAKWTRPIEIDGNANIMAGATLKLDGNMTLTIDAGDTLFVDGTLQLNGNVNIAGNGVIKFDPTGTVTVNPTSTSGWNMVSVPAGVSDYRKSVLYPSATSHAFTYNGSGYVIKDTLKKGLGYWVKFDTPPAISYTGTPVTAETISVQTGWNMFGPISLPFLTSRIQPGTDSVISRYFGYNGSAYYYVDTLRPGQAYWVKMKAAGTLVLNIQSTNNGTTYQSMEAPPCPPGPPPAPTYLTVSKVLACNPSLYHPKLDWTGSGSSSCIQNYKIYRNDCNQYGICSGGALIATVNGSTFTYTDCAILYGDGTSRPAQSCNSTYWVTAVDIWANESATSNNVTVNTSTCLSSAAQHTDVDGGALQAIPTITMLRGSYPNPFNPSTTISYQLAANGTVSLKVYNILGEEIALLAEGTKSTGYYEAHWDASARASGIYYIRMTVVDESGKQIYRIIQKLLLLK